MRSAGNRRSKPAYDAGLIDGVQKGNKLNSKREQALRNKVKGPSSGGLVLEGEYRNNGITESRYFGITGLRYFGISKGVLDSFALWHDYFLAGDGVCFVAAEDEDLIIFDNLICHL